METLEMVGRGLATVKEAAAYLRLSVAKLYLMMDRGQLAFVKLGRSRRINWKAVEALVLRSTIEAKPDPDTAAPADGQGEAVNCSPQG